MARNSEEFNRFRDGLGKILKANPKVVQAAMDQEKREREETRKTKRAASVPASSNRDA